LPKFSPEKEKPGVKWNPQIFAAKCGKNHEKNEAFYQVLYIYSSGKKPPKNQEKCRKIKSYHEKVS
jgi:hypothetical protein